MYLEQVEDYNKCPYLRDFLLVKPSSKCIFIDDFMKGGGTAQGIKDLLKEFR